jgi:hypothetical protein
LTEIVLRYRSNAIVTPNILPGFQKAVEDIGVEFKRLDEPRLQSTTKSLFSRYERALRTEFKCQKMNEIVPTEQIMVIMCTPAEILSPMDLQQFELYIKEVVKERKLEVNHKPSSDLAATNLTTFLKERLSQERIYIITNMDLLASDFTFSLFERWFTKGTFCSINL